MSRGSQGSHVMNDFPFLTSMVSFLCRFLAFRGNEEEGLRERGRTC